MKSQGDLLYVVLTVQTSSGFAHALYAGERQAGENTDDRDRDKKFKKCESALPLSRWRVNA